MVNQLILHEETKMSGQFNMLILYNCNVLQLPKTNIGIGYTEWRKSPT